MRTLRLHNLAMILTLVWSCQEAAAGSITGSNVDQAATIFQDDGFEDDTVGTLPNPPTIGLPYVFGTGVAGVTVVNTQAYTGSNSLYIRRVVSGAADFAHAKFASPYIAGGDKLEFSFAFRAETGGPGADVTLQNGGNPIAQVYYNPAGNGGSGSWRLYDVLNNGPLETVALESANDTWKEVTITYDTGLFNLTVGSSSYTYSGAISGNALDRAVFNTAGGGPLGYYIDAVPEPASFILLVGGAIGGLLHRRHRWMA